jgi:RNA polymerase sigma-70 factor, ECF subfamily
MTDLTALPDEALVQRVRAGDEAAFTALYHRRQAAVYRFALQMSGAEAVAEDVTQEVFLALMREGAGYDPARGSVASFLYGIARNQVLRSLERNRGSVPMPEDGEQGLVSHADPLADLARNEAIASVRRAVLALPTHYREVVVLCDLEELDYLDAAAALGCAVGTVRSRLHRARGLLLEKLRAIRGEGPLPHAVYPARCTT